MKGIQVTWDDEDLYIENRDLTGFLQCVRIECPDSVEAEFLGKIIIQSLKACGVKVYMPPKPAPSVRERSLMS